MAFLKKPTLQRERKWEMSTKKGQCGPTSWICIPLLKKNSSSVQLNSTNIYCVLAGVKAEVIKQRSYPQKLTIEWAARCMNKALTSRPCLPQGLPLPCPSQCGGGDGGPTVSPLICKRFLHGNIYMHTYIQPQNGFPKTICGCICFWVFSRNGTIVLY